MAAARALMCGIRQAHGWGSKGSVLLSFSFTSFLPSSLDSLVARGRAGRCDIIWLPGWLTKQYTQPNGAESSKLTGNSKPSTPPPLTHPKAVSSRRVMPTCMYRLSLPEGSPRGTDGNESNKDMDMSRRDTPCIYTEGREGRILAYHSISSGHSSAVAMFI